ncbi:MAG: pyridoxamine 5'-phosphate oxidase [Chloroflexota bacterium]
MFYAEEGFDLIFLSAGHTRHARAVAAEPQVAATIQEDYADWPGIKGIQVSGTARQLTGEEREAAIGRYRQKYPFIAQPVPALVTALTRVNWYRLEADTVYWIDNSKGFGHRDEIPV